MRISLISDTHGQLPQLAGGELLIHCGDLSDAKASDPLAWQRDLEELGKAPYHLKLLVPGNHDSHLEGSENDGMLSSLGILPLRGELLEVEGLRICGMPGIPRQTGHGAFEFSPPEMKARWSALEALCSRNNFGAGALDILATHIPPRGLLDAWKRPGGLLEHCGCPHLPPVLSRIRPQLLACGHVHGARGMVQWQGIKIINASSCEAHRPGSKRMGTFEIEILKRQTGSPAA